jgi:hypothetical protein
MAAAHATSWLAVRSTALANRTRESSAIGAA